MIITGWQSCKYSIFYLWNACTYRTPWEPAVMLAEGREGLGQGCRPTDGAAATLEPTAAARQPCPRSHGGQPPAVALLDCE